MCKLRIRRCEPHIHDALPGCFIQLRLPIVAFRPPFFTGDASTFLKCQYTIVTTTTAKSALTHCIPGKMLRCPVSCYHLCHWIYFYGPTQLGPQFVDGILLTNAHTRFNNPFSVAQPRSSQHTITCDIYQGAFLHQIWSGLRYPTFLFPLMHAETGLGSAGLHYSMM